MKVFFLVGSFSVIEPMGALQLSAVLRAAGHSCAIGALDEDGLIQRLQDQKADAVALSFMTTEAADFLKFLRILKERLPSIIVIAGGPHPTYFPGIAKTWPLDAIVQGEGEVAIVPLLEALVAGGPICDISGVHTREFKNAPAALVKDLDIFPFADRDLIKDIEPLGTVRMKTFFATRGCPFACAYCFNSAFEDLYNVRGGGSLRRRSVENLIQEIEQVKAKFPVDFIRFGDDAIILKHDAWVDEFCEKYKKRIGLPFYFLINPICVNEKLVKALRLAGCHSVMMGIESGNEKVRESILGR
ncbi:MAG: radical SAM protein, partial [Candidatus Omnitrophota bacterium]